MHLSLKGKKPNNKTKPTTTKHKKNNQKPNKNKKPKPQTCESVLPSLPMHHTTQKAKSSFSLLFFFLTILCLDTEMTYMRYKHE